MQRWTGRAVLAGALAVLASAAVACASPVTERALPGQTVGLAALGNPPAGSTESAGPSPSTAVRVTVPELTNAGTIANLTAPAVTVPATTTTATPATTPAPPTPEPATAPPAGTAPVPETTTAPAPTPVVAPYTTVLGWTGEGKVAYLTFDDGPGPATGQILDILAIKGVQATFCVVGQKVAENPEMTRRIVAGGHTLCNHGWDHPTGFDTLTPDVLDGQIGRTQDAIIAATGHPARYLRAPEGRFGDSAGTVHQAGQQARTLLLGWAIDSRDWTKPGAGAVVSRVVGTVSPGAIILMHDAGGADREQTVEALPGVVDGLRAAGYTLLPLPADPAG